MIFKNFKRHKNLNIETLSKSNEFLKKLNQLIYNVTKTNIIIEMTRLQHKLQEKI